MGVAGVGRRNDPILQQKSTFLVHWPPSHPGLPSSEPPDSPCPPPTQVKWAMALKGGQWGWRVREGERVE